MKKHLSAIIAALTGAILIAVTIMDCNIQNAKKPYVPVEKGLAESENLAEIFSTHLKDIPWGISYEDFCEGYYLVATDEIVDMSNGISVPLMEYVYLGDVRTEFTLKFDNNAGLYEIDGIYQTDGDDFARLKKQFTQEFRGFQYETGSESELCWLSNPIGEYYSAKELSDAYMKANPDAADGASIGQLIGSANEFSAVLYDDGTFGFGAIRHLALVSMFE